MGGRYRRRNGHPVGIICRRTIHCAFNHGRNRAQGQWIKPKGAGQQAGGTPGPYLHHPFGALDTPNSVDVVHLVHIVYIWFIATRRYKRRASHVKNGRFIH